MLITADSAAEGLFTFPRSLSSPKRVSFHYPSAAIYEVAVSGTARDVE
jgi:hypothetical protein